MSRLEILNQSNEKREIKEVNYKSEFDFEKFEIEDENLIKEISQKEEEILSVGKQLAKKTLELGKLLCETQQILSNNKNGTFVAWFTYMGLEKNMVYREINRWDLFQKHRNPQIAEASIRTLEFIKKHENLEAEVIEEIIGNPKEASEKIKEIEKESKEIEENEELELEKIDKKIEKLEDQLNKLKEKKLKILKEKDGIIYKSL